jgi:hypothetical protein
MKRKRFTEEQIIGIVREHALGAKAADLCRWDQRGNFLQLEEQIRRHGSVWGQAAKGA